jgi:hypothetical protein
MKALRNIDRGDVRTQGPIPQRAWRLYYLYDKQQWVLDLEEVRQASYDISGREVSTKPVNWPLTENESPAEAP